MQHAKNALRAKPDVMASARHAVKAGASAANAVQVAVVTTAAVSEAMLPALRQIQQVSRLRPALPQLLQ